MGGAGEGRGGCGPVIDFAEWMGGGFEGLEPGAWDVEPPKAAWARAGDDGKGSIGVDDEDAAAVPASEGDGGAVRRVRREHRLGRDGSFRRIGGTFGHGKAPGVTAGVVERHGFHKDSRVAVTSTEGSIELLKGSVRGARGWWKLGSVSLRRPVGVS